VSNACFGDTSDDPLARQRPEGVHPRLKFGKFGQEAMTTIEVRSKFSAPNAVTARHAFLTLRASNDVVADFAYHRTKRGINLVTETVAVLYSVWMLLNVLDPCFRGDERGKTE
jgi:hypothetical protein